MGRPATVDELLAQAEANGYKRGAHVERDQVRNKEKHGDKTKKDQDATLHRYVLWKLDEMRGDAVERQLPLPDEETAREHCLRSEIAAPDLATVKDFIRFYIATSTPQLADRPTDDSINTVAEWFFAGFTRVTGTATNEEDRSEVYNWVRKTLTKEGLVVHKRKPKHNFTPRELIRLLRTLWTKDDLIFIPERYRIQFTFIVRVYCWTGARISAFFTGGLRYRDVELILQRVSFGGWRVIYKIDQRWVKNNRDPENIVFGTAGREHERFIYDDTAFLLAMAMEDKALFGYETLADLQEQEIPAGEDFVKLRFKESILDKPILRKCTKADGVTDEAMPKSAFTDILRSTFRNAAYLCANSIHAIRRQLGKKVDEHELYTEVHRSQHLTQADPRIFGQSYVADMSSVDGIGAFLGEQIDHSHIDYFQSLERFRESGLPCELPAGVEESLKEDRQLQELEAEVQKCSYTDPSMLKESKKRLASYLKTLKRNKLRQYQEIWIQRRRDWKILTRGKEQPHNLDRTDLVQSLCLLFPERARLAQKMVSDEPLTSEARWLAIEDLCTLCTRDLTVLYLPGHQPIGGACPVKCCRLELDRLPKAHRNQHVQACVRREIASKKECLQADVHYCYLCFSWVVGPEEWEGHCQAHIPTLTSKRCGTITYCHTLVRPAYCPFCLGAINKPAGERLQSWRRDHSLWQHVESHIEGRAWPLTCPHHSSSPVLRDDKDLQFHLIDEHGFGRTRPKPHVKISASSVDPAKKSGSKRKFSDDGDELFWMPAEELPPSNTTKRIRSSPSTIAPSLLSQPGDSVEAALSRTDHAPPSPVAVTGCANFRSSEETLSDGFNFKHGSPADIPSCDSTLVDSPRCDNSLFSLFLRSPSPDGMRELRDRDVDDEQTGANLLNSSLPESGAAAAAAAEEMPYNDQRLDAPSETPAKIRIHLRVKPLKTTIVLRCSAPKSKQQGALRRLRKTKSACRR